MANPPRPYKYACERCRTSKLRCPLESVESTGKCNRCLGLNAHCVFQPVAPRQRRRKDDARVTRLEEELRELKSMLTDHRDPKSTTSQAAGLLSRSPRLPSITTDEVPTKDACVPTSISDRLAAELHQIFADFLLPEYPIVEILESFDALRVSKPVLLLATITAASSTRSPSLFAKLHSRLVRQVTEKAIIRGEKSIELVQSILILSSWYYPPEDLQHLNFYQWFQIASAMATQLGLDGMSHLPNFDLSMQRARWRTILSIFQSSSAVAMSLRAQCAITFTPATREILDAFDTFPAAINDKRLVAWLKLQVIAEEIERAKSIETTFDMDTYLRSYEAWELSLEPGNMNASLKVHYEYCKARLFEAALIPLRDVEELVPPYFSQRRQIELQHPIIDYASSRAILGLINACHAIMDNILTLDDSLLLCCPTFTFAKSLYALKVIFMLNSVKGNPYRPYITDGYNLKTESYADEFCEKLVAVAGSEGCRVPSMILYAAKKIILRFAEVQDQSLSGNALDINTGDIDFADQYLQRPIECASDLFRDLPSAKSTSYIGASKLQALPETMDLHDFAPMATPHVALDLAHELTTWDWDYPESFWTYNIE